MSLKATLTPPGVTPGLDASLRRRRYVRRRDDVGRHWILSMCPGAVFVGIVNVTSWLFDVASPGRRHADVRTVSSRVPISVGLCDRVELALARFNESPPAIAHAYVCTRSFDSLSETSGTSPACLLLLQVLALPGIGSSDGSFNRERNL